MRKRKRRRVRPRLTAAQIQQLKQAVIDLDGKYRSQAEALLHAFLIAKRVDEEDTKRNIAQV